METKVDLNEEEIKEKYAIKINGEIIPFDYYHKFDKEGKFKIEYIFKDNLIKTNHLFYQCKYFTSVDLSNFKAQNTTNFRGIFQRCINLTNIDLSNLDTQNVTDMSKMFFDCVSLKNINLSSLNTQNVTDMSAMLCACEALTNIDLSNFNT